MNLRPLVALAAALAATACAGQIPFEAPPAPNPTQVVVVSQIGRLATATPIGGGATRIPPTPTFDPSFNAILTPLAAEAQATGTAVAGTATPPVRPTRTPAPSATPYPTIELPAPPLPTYADFGPPAARTPLAALAPLVLPTERATRVPTRTPTPLPPDPTGDNADLAHALALPVGTERRGQLNGPKAVDVFRFDVPTVDSTILVRLSGPEAQYYRVYLISPGRQSAAAARPVGSGTAARQIRYPARSETGVWYVEVTSDGKHVPNGAYTLKVDVKEPTIGGA